jgi:hypothetical protein
VVTHPTTNLPVHGLNMGERTGSLVFHVLWSYVKDFCLIYVIYLLKNEALGFNRSERAILNC